jgi:hypothetical protein
VYPRIDTIIELRRQSFPEVFTMATKNMPPPDPRKNRAARIAAMQARVTEGLNSGVGDRTMDELRATARAQASEPRR